MEFRLSECTVLILKTGKVIRGVEVVMPDGEMMKYIEEGRGYKYLL